MDNKTLWTKDFSLITIGTIISAIGGQAISLPISFLVFQETQSTLLSAIIFVCGMIPGFILPIFIAPFIDNCKKKRMIISLDYIYSLLYIVFAILSYVFGFNYLLYVFIGLIGGTIGSIYRLTFNAWYPDLIPLGFEQKGYAISSTIYPTVIMVFSPLSAIIYKFIPIYILFLMVSFFLFIAASFETFISHKGLPKIKKPWNIESYKQDFKSGLVYIRKEKGIRNIYIYMSITMGVSTGVMILSQAFFQTSAYLTLTMFAFLKTIETAGRVIGGFFQYKIDIKAEKRFSITRFVYCFYEVMDMMLLFLPYPLMAINRFLCGALGTTSATLRQASVFAYLPEDKRAKIEAFFQVLMHLSLIIFQLLAGALGDLLGYRKTVVLLSSFALICVYIFIIKPSKVNKLVYSAVRTDHDLDND